MNIKNFKLVLNKIIDCPESWNQKEWHCDSSHCFFGWAQILAGKRENNKTVQSDARSFLGLNKQEAEYISHIDRKIEDFENFLQFYEENPDGYGSDNYNYIGCDRDGYNRNGYDEDG